MSKYRQIYLLLKDLKRRGRSMKGNFWHLWSSLLPPSSSWSHVGKLQASFFIIHKNVWDSFVPQHYLKIKHFIRLIFLVESSTLHLPIGPSSARYLTHLTSQVVSLMSVGLFIGLSGTCTLLIWGHNEYASLLHLLMTST